MWEPLALPPPHSQPCCYLWAPGTSVIILKIGGKKYLILAIALQLLFSMPFFFLLDCWFCRRVNRPCNYPTHAWLGVYVGLSVNSSRCWAKLSCPLGAGSCKKQTNKTISFHHNQGPWLWWELMIYLKKARTQSWCLSRFELNFACSCFKCEPTPLSKAPARAVALRSVMHQWRSKDQASATERFGALMASVFRLLSCPAAFHFYRVRPLTAWLFSLFVCFIMLVSCCE